MTGTSAGAKKGAKIRKQQHQQQDPRKNQNRGDKNREPDQDEE